jgi:phosphoglycerate dehydrogenase-like enzyme
MKVAIAPSTTPEWVREAVAAGGGEPVDPGPSVEALVWSHPHDVDGLRATLHESPDVRWVQLPWAGVEGFAGAGVFDDGRQWTCGKGVYADEVAEHALALALAGFRDLPTRVTARSWAPPSGRSLFDARVTVLGGGGITESLLTLLRPFRCEVTVVRRRNQRFEGAARTASADRLHDVLPGADLVVLALALTPETVGVIGAQELDLMERHAWLVNVARGRHVVTDDLVDALRNEQIGGAGLDVTDPEPLPDGHPLWDEPRCIITPHVANTPEMARPVLTRRITENVRRFAAGEPLLGPVDPEAGY